METERKYWLKNEKHLAGHLKLDKPAFEALGAYLVAARNELCDNNFCGIRIVFIWITHWTG